MKYLFTAYFIIMSLFLFSAMFAHADPPVAAWWPIGTDSGNVFTSKDDCKRLGGGPTCVDATACRPEVCSPDINNVMQTDSVKQAAVAADVSDSSARSGKINQVKNAVKTCVKNWASLTDPQKNLCQLAALKLAILADLKATDF